MKKIRYIVFLLSFSILLKAQLNQGVVNYKVINIDTINNLIVPQDSIYSKFVFKPNKTKWEMGYLNSNEITKTIVNNEDYYVIMVHLDEKTALHGETKNGNSINKLLNYVDTSLIVTKTNITKTIAGRTCKKMYLKFHHSLPPMVIWYDEFINCNSIIPGAGNNGKNIKGLILEYEIQNSIGKSIITAYSVNFGNVSNTNFNPNLSGFQITELEREDGGQCNGHH